MGFLTQGTGRVTKIYFFRVSITFRVLQTSSLQPTGFCHRLSHGRYAASSSEAVTAGTRIARRDDVLRVRSWERKDGLPELGRDCCNGGRIVSRREFTDVLRDVWWGRAVWSSCGSRMATTSLHARTTALFNVSGTSALAVRRRGRAGPKEARDRYLVVGPHRQNVPFYICLNIGLHIDF